MVQPLANRFIPADFLTSNHYTFGQIKVSNSGLMGLMSDVGYAFLEVEDANVSRIVKPDKVINYAPEIRLVKRQVLAICLNKREYVGSQAILRGGYARAYQYPVQINTPVYEIQGNVEWSGRFDFAALMSEGSNDFFAIYDVTINATLFPALHLERAVILLNRRFVDSLVLVRQDGKEV